MIEFEQNQLLTQAGVRILERDGSIVRLAIATDRGEVAIYADMVRIEDRLILDRVDVEGVGLTLRIIRRVAKALGEGEDVAEVIIQGGIRSSGAHPGSSPTPIRVKVNS